MTGLDLVEQLAQEKLQRLTTQYGGFRMAMTDREKQIWWDAERTLEIIKVARGFNGRQADDGKHCVGIYGTDKTIRFLLHWGVAPLVFIAFWSLIFLGYLYPTALIFVSLAISFSIFAVVIQKLVRDELKNG